MHTTPHNIVSTKGRLSGLFSQDGGRLSYPSLARFWRRSIRNRRWRRLSTAERGLYRCALWVAKARGSITNTRLMVQVIRIVLKLFDGFQSRIAEAGRARAMMMFREYARPGGVFSWAPRMREWLDDPKYLMYLGVLEVNA